MRQGMKLLLCLEEITISKEILLISPCEKFCRTYTDVYWRRLLGLRAPMLPVALNPNNHLHVLCNAMCKVLSARITAIAM